jgi:hypothetical protein
MWTIEHRTETTAAPEAVWRLWSHIGEWPQVGTPTSNGPSCRAFHSRETITM